MIHARPDTIHPSNRLNDLGVDSLTKVELIGELEARLGFRVDDAAAGRPIRPVISGAAKDSGYIDCDLQDENRRQVAKEPMTGRCRVAKALAVLPLRA